MEKNAFFSNQVRTALCKKEKTFRGIFEKVDEKNSDFSTVQFMLELNLNKIMKNQLSQQICLKIFDSFILYSKVIFQLTSYNVNFNFRISFKIIKKYVISIPNLKQSLSSMKMTHQKF